MANFEVNYDWFKQVVPEGLPVPASILLSGPGGSGKPLIGLGAVASWLQQGGKVIFVPLQYPDRSFTETDLKTLYGVDLAEYAGSVFFMAFDLERRPDVDDIQRTGPDMLNANFVNPDVWDAAVGMAVEALGPSERGTLIFGSAVNLLLFSKTYGEAMLGHLKALLQKDTAETYLLSLSNNVMADKIAELEAAADHLLLAEMTKPERDLTLRAVRVKDAPYKQEPIIVPFDKALLAEMKQLADASRQRNLPAIKQI